MLANSVRNLGQAPASGKKAEHPVGSGLQHLGAFAGGDLLNHGTHSMDCPIVKLEGVVAGEPVSLCIWLGRRDPAHLHVHDGFPRLEHSTVDGLCFPRDLWNQLVHSSANVLGHRLSMEPRETLIDANPTKVAIHKAQANRGCLIEMLQFSELLAGSPLALLQSLLGLTVCRNVHAGSRHANRPSVSRCTFPRTRNQRMLPSLSTARWATS